jgi:hypothetical protein
MPPRHHYWTIILEGKPTAFRAHTQDELMPTLRQLQARHPDAVMKWFARGRLWESQEQERAEALARRRPKTRPMLERRSPDWRPGGEHKDPRDRFKVPRDEKRRRFAEKARRERSMPPKGAGPAPPREPGQRARPDRPPARRGPSPSFRRNPRGGNRGSGGGGNR